MKRFNFSLQKVLDYREFEKKQAQAELGKAVSVETNIQNTLNMIAESRAKSVQETDKMRDLNSLYNAGLYFQLLNQRRDEMLEELAKAKIVTNENGEEEYVEPTDEEFEAVQKAYDALLEEEENAEE